MDSNTWNKYDHQCYKRKKQGREGEIIKLPVIEKGKNRHNDHSKEKP